MYLKALLDGDLHSRARPTFIPGACRQEEKAFFSSSHAGWDRGGQEKQREHWLGFCLGIGNALLSAKQELEHEALSTCLDLGAA